MTSAPEPAPDFAASIAYVIHQETLGGAACGWDHCSGCYDTEDGRPTGHYPHSDIFGCEVGSGCSECGGLGVVWSHYSKDELEDMACEVSAPAMSALSHPEPVAQEAVAWQHRTRGRYEGAQWGAWLDGRANFTQMDYEERPLYLHPSPSPEQGEDDLVQRLKDAVTDTFEHDAEGDGYYDTPLTFLVREAATAISTLRARVAELEARATPQAGASEAEPVAWMRDYPDMTCLTTTKPEPPEPGWRDIWMPLYATPPDSDAVRAGMVLVPRIPTKAMHKAAWKACDNGMKPGKDWDEFNGRLWTAMLDTALSNQGSSSNGQ